MNKNIYTNRFIIVLFSFLFSVCISTLFVFQYDTYQLDGSTHVMLKEETFAHWWQAANIIEQIKNDVNFFVAGNEVFTKPLPQRIVAIYSSILNFDILVDQADKINLGNKIPFLIIQSLVYYLSVLFFYKHIGNLCSDRTKIFILLFLCLEPTIIQYHSSFWSESFYFSIQLIVLGLTLKLDKKIFDFLLLGFFLGLLFLQRTVGIFYIFIIIFYFITFSNEKKIKNLFLILVPYIMVLSLLGLHNYLRADRFYIMPTESSYSQYRYFTKDILATKMNKTISEINKIEVEKGLEWIDLNLPEANNYELEKNKTLLGLARSIKKENLRIDFYDYMKTRNFEILSDYPFETLKKSIKGMTHFSVLNPFFVYYDLEYFKNYSSHIIGDFYFSDKHKELIPYRIFYSLLIFSIILIGFFKLFKQNLKLTILCTFSILYYYILLGWYGKTRLFVPTLIYFSIFFGAGLDFLVSRIKLFYLSKK